MSDKKEKLCKEINAPGSWPKFGFRVTHQLEMTEFIEDSPGGKVAQVVFETSDEDPLEVGIITIGGKRYAFYKAEVHAALSNLLNGGLNWK